MKNDEARPLPIEFRAIRAIGEERARQREKWDAQVDDANTFAQWVAFTTRQLGRGVIYARELPHPEPGDDWRAFRKVMVRVAALAVAAIESMDRKLERLASGGAS